ncbi:LLM class flavin-dependent oxidoreductase [Paenibacillus thermotolerans]|uniref:LLM class flavin-dependent oxidoreductase n=1 Tax=Paenibacillus thermotolerans TaxID=3027807 RepID=UPI0023689119|nr:MULTISPECIES: LLM class flavin-dependent oxidoreductase [unclassified Paenibacillus]
MTLKLSVLDHTHISEGRTAKDALDEAVKLAQATEALGFGRYWVSEHHGTPSLASSSPEILIAHLAANTNRIRVGSGGVMLPHYSAYKVAENFRLLEALHPGRIDAGLGRAPGGMPIATRALQEGKYLEIDEYPQQVEDLVGYLHDALPPEHRFARLRAAPQIQTAPEVWLLGSSDGSAAIAAAQGTAYAFAHFFGTGYDAKAVMDIYFSRFRPSAHNEKPRALAAVLVVCAETDEEANRLATSGDLFFTSLYKGHDLPHLPSVSTAADYPYTEYDLQMIRQMRSNRFIGSPERVKQQLLELGERLGVDELMVVSPIHGFEERVHSYRLLSEAFGLA